MARQYESKYKFTYRRTNKLSPDTVKKLEEAASHRLNVSESCAYAEIARETYYQWLKRVPGLSDKLDDLRTLPIIKAKRRIISQLDFDTNAAFRFLEKENPDEYGEKLKLEHSGSISNDSIEHPEDEALRLELKKRLVENMQKRAKEKEASEPHAPKA